MARSLPDDELATLSSPPVQLSAMPGYPLVMAARVLRHAMDHVLREVDLTTPQWGTLACIGYGEGLTGAELARIHQLTPQTMHTILQNLENAGLILREPDAEHGTLLRLRLTDEGRERLDDAMQGVHAVQEQMVSGLDDDERRTLEKLLNRCTAALLSENLTPLPDVACDD